MSRPCAHPTCLLMLVLTCCIDSVLFIIVIMAEENDAWEFEQWCTTNELSEDTISAMTEMGFNSYKTLALLDEAKIKQYFGKKLMPAQLLLLSHGVSILHMQDTQSRTRTYHEEETPEENPGNQLPENKEDPKTVLEAGGSLSAAALLDLLKDHPTLAGAKSLPDPQARGETFMDPFQFGKGLCASKCRAVPEYVSNLTRGEQPTTVTIGGVEFASNMSRKVPHEKLTMAQFMEGALRITRDLVLEDGANLDQVMDYLNYLIQVAVFAQSFPWVNVLSYDKIYRKEQASLGFRWGTASPFLMTSHLQKPTPQGDGATKRRPQTQAKTDPKSGKTICFKFNGLNGCQLRNCNFAHVCRVCFEDHPEVQHKAEKSSKN